jgi:hypothetical protein
VGAVITVRYRALPDRVRTWSVWLIDAGLDTPLLAGFVREDLLSWVARTGAGPTDLGAGFRGRREAAAWISLREALRKNKSACYRRKDGSMSTPRECASWGAQTTRPSSPKKRGRPQLCMGCAEETSRFPQGVPTKPIIRRAAYRAALRVRRVSLQLDLVDLLVPAT